MLTIFQYHDAQTASSEMGQKIRAELPRSWRGSPPLSALQGTALGILCSPVPLHATFLPPSSLIVRPPHRNDAFRLGQPLLWYSNIHGSFEKKQYSNLTICAVSILLVNAVAVLSEDRFLARSTPPFSLIEILVEWSVLIK